MAWAEAGVLDRLIIARPHNIYGPDMGREHVIPQFCIRMNQLVKETPSGTIQFPIQGTGQETRSFCYIDDCISQFNLLLQKAEHMGVYHVGNMEERSITDVAQGVAKCYDRTVKVVPGILPKGSPTRRLPDTTKITALGYEQATTFEDGLAQTVDWYKKE
jgi:nucleoside-diphosphate-sugar epimerase